MDLPFDGGISCFFADSAPNAVRDVINGGKKNQILNPDYPYAKRMSRNAYEDELDALQIELVRLQAWVRTTGKRIVVVFEGRDAAGKGGGVIKRIVQRLNPRVARVVALPKPTEREQSQWYFQRYINHLPTQGEMVFFDRSWYNRPGVEKVMNFCSEEEYLKFLQQCKYL